MTTIAINGFGRIGRLVFRALVEQGHLGTTFNVVAVGDIVPADNLAYLLKYDSTQGKFSGTVSSKKSSPELEEDDVLIVNGHEIKVVSARSPEGLPWKELGVEVVDVNARQASIARGAFLNFGKGRHPAKLNFGDTFSYALAMHLAEPLLFKGSDFSQTNVTPAV